MQTAREIREAFLTYFERHGHRRVRSASLVPGDDPTLLFTNAGMVPFKNVFTGEESREYKRAASSQKCLRVSGKHNDLENVGRTARHHTFFEMLGNFSFGDYFKEKAIDFAWELMVTQMGVPAARLAATVFKGEDGVPADEEARRLWARYLPEGQILALGKKDNFWSMGATGPCGPCSELHYHVSDDLPCPEPSCLGVACECDRWVEVWNLVFMQFDAQPDGRMDDLPAPSVDTGMGLERVAAVVQGKTSNYDTDLFGGLIARISDRCSKAYGAAEESDVSMRVIADHARSTAFLMADGVFPANEGRGYVLRRIMRRAIRHGTKLGLDDLFLHESALAVVDEMGQDYPELSDGRSLIERLTRQEESRFRETIDQGLRLLGDNEDWSERDGRRVLPGGVAFTLYDTYGFPVDLVEVIGAEQGFGVDVEGFEHQMEQQRERSRAASNFTGGGGEEAAATYRGVLNRVGATQFVGYEATEAEAEVVALLVDGKEVEAAEAGTRVEVVSSRSPFYGESGGQIGDQGLLEGPDFSVEIEDTQRPLPELLVHRGVVRAGEVRVGGTGRFVVDADRRQAIRLNHSATHLLHWALREVLGGHVKQAGSLVAPDRLRFDFNHFGPMTPEEIGKVEELVNDKIRENWAADVAEMPMAEAEAKGAIAFFGEKYGDVVRVVAVAPESVELCGGTHVERSGDIGFFRITTEEGIAAGVRRIEAVTGPGAQRYVRELAETVDRAAELLRSSPAEVVDRVERLLAQQKKLEREVDALQKKLATQRSQDVMSEVREVGGVKVLAMKSEVGDAKGLRDFGDKLRERLPSGVVVLGGATGDKVTLVAMVSPDLTDRFQAGKIIGEIAPLVGGRGGGKPAMAQGGGSQPENLDAALEKVYEIVGR